MSTSCRALELALLYKKTHLDTVLWYRQRYLKSTKHEETKPQFLQFAQQVVACFFILVSHSRIKVAIHRKLVFEEAIQLVKAPLSSCT